MHIIILTAAVPRAPLHSITMKSFYDNLALSDMSKYKFTHIINIDSPSKLIEQGFTVQDTIDNYKSIIPDIVEQYYIDSQKACFSDTYKRLFIEGEKHIKNKNTIIIWLEDDWEITNKKNILNIISTIVPKFNDIYPSYFTIGLSSYVINNHPTIYSESLFKYFANFYKNCTEKLDPDYLQHNCYKYHFSKKIRTAILTYITEDKDKNKIIKYVSKRIKNYFNNKIVTSNLNDIDVNVKNTYYYYYGFIDNNNWINDLGREWIKERGIKKWEKNGNQIKTYQ